MMMIKRWYLNHSFHSSILYVNKNIICQFDFYVVSQLTQSISSKHFEINRIIMFFIFSRNHVFDILLWNMSLKCERVIFFQYAKFNAFIFCRLINSLRDKQHYFYDISQISTYDNFNWTILISFRDEMKWIFRFSRNNDAIKSNETNFSLLINEVVTFMYIKINNTISISEIFAYK